MENSTQMFTIIKYQKKALNFSSICLSVILIDSVSRKDRNCYPQVFLEKFNNIAKRKKKTSKIITDDIEISSDDSDKENSNEEN